MDPLRIAIRAVFAYVFVLAMLRVSGRRTVGQGDTASFVLALIIGDLFDDLFWAEVSAAQFVVAAGTLVIAHVWTTTARTTPGRRRWAVRPGGAGE